MNDAARQPASGGNESAKRLAFAGGLLFAVWVAGLIWLAVETSNPVTLNVAQMMNADCVVVAELSDAETGEFQLVTKIEGREPPETFRVLGIADITGPESGRWLLALNRERAGDYTVVPVLYRDRKLLLVYPGDDEVVAQARELLGIE